ncbi:MAG: SpoIIE family protein phosphatase, partial [candidate division KSB1 bacterium]|nr:SpoIIE family protein phosphatase [candidate division KSB1 bacterium]
RPAEDFLIDLEGEGITGKILLFLLITVIVINSFNTFWVNYLNKRQKLACFAGGLLLLPAAVMLATLSQHKIISYYSLTLGMFLRQVGLFLSIYWAMAVVSILLHLPTAGIYDRKMKEVASLHKLSRVISSEFDPDKLVGLITRQSSEVIEANAVWLEVLDLPTGRLRLASSNNLKETERKEIGLYSEQGIGGWILKNKFSVLINEVGKDSRTNYFKKINRNIGSLLAVPLVSYDKILGILYAVKFDEYGFGLDDQNMLQAFADQAAVALENARLVKESIIKERLEQELKVAHDAQMKLLPKTMPQLEGLDIDAICVTANEVGGDYYDFFLLDENRLAVVIGDVSGKGPEAAFYMAEVKGIIESLSRTYASPKELLIKTNEILYGRIDRKIFITLIYSVIDRSQRKLMFSRAGHCPLIYCPGGNGQARFIEPRGLGVGLEKGKLFSQIIEEKSLCLHPGDTVLLYTDGVVEARNSQQEEFGEQHFLEVTAQWAHLNCSEIKNKIVEEVRAFSGPTRPHDDLTMVVMKLM